MRTEDDYTLTPCGPLGGLTGVAQGGKFLGEFEDNGAALEFIREHMETQQYWPSIYWVSDHGNEWPIDLEGNEVEEVELCEGCYCDPCECLPDDCDCDP